jgi:hypothetical protein
MAGPDRKQHCCAMMTDNVENSCADHPNRHDCPDMLIDYRPGSYRYGIMIHDGGLSMIAIAFCPWCGTRLSATIL